MIIMNTSRNGENQWPSYVYVTFNEITLFAAFLAQLDERVSVFWCRQDDVTQLKHYVSDMILCDSK